MKLFEVWILILKTKPKKKEFEFTLWFKYIKKIIFYYHVTNMFGNMYFNKTLRLLNGTSAILLFLSNKLLICLTAINYFFSAKYHPVTLFETAPILVMASKKFMRCIHREICAMQCDWKRLLYGKVEWTMNLSFD